MVRSCQKAGEEAASAAYEKGTARAHSRRVQSDVAYDRLYRGGGNRNVPARTSLVKIRKSTSTRRSALSYSFNFPALLKFYPFRRSSKRRLPCPPVKLLRYSNTRCPRG